VPAEIEHAPILAVYYLPVKLAGNADRELDLNQFLI
jgi:hypothetical protein